jgi:hypothetical protein
MRDLVLFLAAKDLRSAANLRKGRPNQLLQTCNIAHVPDIGATRQPKQKPNSKNRSIPPPDAASVTPEICSLQGTVETNPIAA